MMNDERSSPNSSSQMRGWFKLIETIRQTDPPLTSPEKVFSTERVESFSDDENDDVDDNNEDDNRDSSPPEAPAKKRTKRITIRKSNRMKKSTSIPCGTDLDELPGNEERDERFLHYFDLNTLSLHFNTCLYIEKRTAAYPKQQIFKSRHNVLNKIFRIDYLKTNSSNESSIDSSPTAQSFKKDWSSNRHRSSRKNFFHQLQLNPKRTFFSSTSSSTLTEATPSICSSSMSNVDVERMKDILLRTYYPLLYYQLEHENHFGAKAKFSSEIVQTKSSAPVVERRVSEEIPVNETREKRPLINDENEKETNKKLRIESSDDDDDEEEEQLPDQLPQPIIVTNGLRSNFYKNETISSKQRSLRNRPDPSARLPPIYSGLFADFRLPYDIFWQQQKNELSNRRNKSKKTRPTTNPLIFTDEKTFVKTCRLFLWRNWKRIDEKILPLVFPQNFYHRKFDANFVLSKSDFIRLFVTHIRRSHFARTGRCRSELIDDRSQFAQLAQFQFLLNEMFESILNFKCPSSDILPSNALKKCPEKEFFPLYYEMIVEPIDLSIIRRKLNASKYRKLDAFESDLLLLFHNAISYCGDDSEVGQAVKQLKEFFLFELKTNFAKSFALFDRSNFVELVDPSANEFAEFAARLHRRETLDGIVRQCLYETIFNIDSNVPSKISKEIFLHCRCGSFFEETILVQCYACQLWQHASCVEIKDSYRPYFCFECDPLCEENPSFCRKVDVRIPLANSSTSFSTLTRSDGFVIRINETYRLSTGDKEIFHVERLFIDENQREKAQGFFYRRPEQIFMEKNSQRKYFANELIRCQFHQDTRTIETFERPCYILDLSTYAKGRPMNEFTSELTRNDLFVCEFRLDKSGKTLTKLVKSKQTSVNTKSYCFDYHLEKFIMKRDQQQFLDEEFPRRFVVRHRLSSNKTRSERCAHLHELISTLFSSQNSKCS